MIVLRREVVSLSVSLSIILAAPARCPAHSTDRTSDFPPRIAQAPPQLTFEHESTTAPPGKRPARRAPPRCTTEVAGTLRQRSAQKAEPGRAWASRSAPCNTRTLKAQPARGPTEPRA